MECTTSYGSSISASRLAYDWICICYSIWGLTSIIVYQNFGTTTTSIGQDGHAGSFMIDLPSIEGTTEQSGPTYHICRLSGPPCGALLGGSIQSIRAHLRFHGHRYEECSIISCPWQGCTAQLQYMSVPRHIRSTHLGVRFRCEQCGKTLTREEGLAKHMRRCTGDS
ncbi:hypothetical protein SCLCIDRAFT_1018978 [Scleroderma citrinum Foug A]|uniref:C2H2-type domain-containing protein n=1 Tax=Scleroderma citrinum Foug A TaxID=1036808 RepID=A0A0C3A3V3_9AGAM|nr:hypothetical protein SCLCIDRAFT_1018978 [Scleroderma citrinum Foug A]